MNKIELINELMEFVKERRVMVNVSPLILYATQNDSKQIGQDYLYGDLNHLEVIEERIKGEYLVICNGSGYERNYRDMNGLSKTIIEGIYQELIGELPQKDIVLGNTHKNIDLNVVLKKGQIVSFFTSTRINDCDYEDIDIMEEDITIGEYWKQEKRFYCENDITLKVVSILDNLTSHGEGGWYTYDIVNQYGDKKVVIDPTCAISIMYENWKWENDMSYEGVFNEKD